MNSFFLSIILVTTCLQLYPTDGVVMRPTRMRRNISSAILDSIYKYTDFPDVAHSHGKGENLSWYGADARQVLR